MLRAFYNLGVAVVGVVLSALLFDAAADNTVRRARQLCDEGRRAWRGDGDDKTIGDAEGENNGVRVLYCRECDAPLTQDTNRIDKHTGNIMGCRRPPGLCARLNKTGVYADADIDDAAPAPRE